MLKHFGVKRARVLAVLWTATIFILCLIPSDDIPEVHVPFVDKWTHFILFAVFSFLWLASVKGLNSRIISLVLIAAVFLGWLVEVLQGQLTFLGRSQDNMDTLADSVGGVIGILVYYLIYKWQHRHTSNNHDRLNNAS